MRSKLKIFIGIFGSLVVITLVTLLILRYLVTKSFPAVDGTIVVAGLQNPATVQRDEFGIPHITAGNEHDLFFAQGYVHAQDRLWQMDVARRAGEGRLSEVFGPSTVKFDKLFRTVGMERIAEKLEQNLHPESRRILQAYSDGVNAFIRSHRGKYPIEFDMLNYAPEEWKPIHSLLVSRLMAWELNISWYVDLVLGDVYKTFGEEKANEIFPTYPENIPVIVPKGLHAEVISGQSAQVDRCRPGVQDVFRDDRNSYRKQCVGCRAAKIRERESHAGQRPASRFLRSVKMV